MTMRNPFLSTIILSTILLLNACLPSADPYPYRPPGDVTAEAQAWSDSLEEYIELWVQGLVSDSIPDHLIPQGVSDSKNFYLKNPDAVSAAETWAYRYARPINKDSLYAGIPDPKVTYLYLGTALAPFGSKLIIEGEFPRCRFFSIQITPPLNGIEYYAQRQFGTAEVSVVDVDIEPMPGHTNPFRVGADRQATERSFRYSFELAAGDPTSLNGPAHIYPYRHNINTRTGALLSYQGPLGHKTLVGTPLAVPGDWDLGALWLRIYEPDEGAGPLGGVPMPKVYFELPNGARYFIGSDFSALQSRGDKTIANRVTITQPNPYFGPQVGWFKSWGITRSILSGVCQANGWSRPDSSARIRDIDLGWTGRGEFQPAPGNIEPHATTNNYASYLGRKVAVPPGMVAVLTGRLPTFPSTRNGEPVMQPGEVRYWSICGIDDDPLSPLPATTIHAISDDDVVIDENRNYIIAYSRQTDRPTNATAANGVSWVDWGTQSDMGLLMRWVNVAPDWRFAYAPQEHNLDFSRSDWAGALYDSTLIGINWRNGFMRCFLPRIHYMSKSEFEALGNDLDAEKIPVWVDNDYTRPGAADSQMGFVTAASTLDGSVANQPANCNDGNLQTAWSSAFGQAQNWVQVDLGAVKKISAVKLHWDWIFFGKAYQISVSNDQSNWADIASTVNGDGAVDLYSHLQGVEGRYVRLELSNFNIAYYRLLELEVYTADCRCEAPVTGAPMPIPIALDLRIYPNPAAGRFVAELVGLSQTYSEVAYTLYNLSGKAVWRQKGGLRQEIDTTYLPKGIYLLQARIKGGQKTAKIIIE